MNRLLHHWFAKLRRPGARVRTPARPRRTCLHPEALEDRRLLSTFNVNTLMDLSISAGVNTTTGTIIGTKFVTLRSAIEAANATPGNNTIKLTKTGTYKITIPGAGEDNNQTGDFDIFPIPNASSPSSLTIVNTSRGNVAVSGNRLDRVFDINPNNVTLPAGKFNVVLKGFTVENGIASTGDGPAGSGGGIRDQGNVNLTLTHMVVTNNSATADGGGVVMFNTDNNSWTLTLNNTVISNNHAGDAGGGIDTDGTGTVVINKSQIIGNTDIHQGAGIYVDVAAGSSSPLGADMTMTGTVVSNNVALAHDVTASGGGISNAGTGTINILNSTVENNFSGGMGGGFSDENNNGTLVVKNSLFLNNSAISDGGAIQEGGPSTTITNTEFKGNSSGANGGALFANGITLTVQSSTFANNTASGNGDSTGGGAIEIETTGTGSAGSTITDTTITDNRALNNAGANGGGIDVGSGSLALLHDTINANFADNGGGIANFGTLTVSDSTITGNSAGVNGGGIANESGGTATVSGSSFSNNSAGVNGGGIANESGGTATVSGNSFSNNSAGTDGGGIFNSGMLTQSGNSFTGNSPDGVS